MRTSDYPLPVRIAWGLGYDFVAAYTWPAIGLVALATLLVVWACIRYRWRRRGPRAWLCPRCSYDLRGVVEKTGYPLTCSECAQEIGSQRFLRRTRVAWRLVGVACLIIVAAHLTARGPDIVHRRWIRVVPTTAMVLLPMNVTEWTLTQLNLSAAPVERRVWHEELTRRLAGGRVWAWQERILFKRVEWVCKARPDYGITPSQYEMAGRMKTMRADADHDDEFGRRLIRLAESADVPLHVEW
jgi:hypothetical protein